MPGEWRCGGYCDGETKMKRGGGSKKKVKRRRWWSELKGLRWWKLFAVEAVEAVWVDREGKG